MTSTRYNIFTCITLSLLLGATGMVVGDEFDAEFEDEFEFDFSFKPKSTIDTFPMQGIASDELSNAVIKGALQNYDSATPFELEKPAYQKVDENDEQEKKVQVEERGRMSNTGEINPELLISPETPRIELEFRYDTGRVLDNNNVTVERP